MIIDIRSKIEHEITKTNSDPKSWPAGAFDYELLLHDVDDDTIFQLCEWLAGNCSENFVCVRKTSELIAGGSTNNLSKWTRRKRLGRDKFDREQIDVMIRLDEADITAFRFVWII